MKAIIEQKSDDETETDVVLTAEGNRLFSFCLSTEQKARDFSADLQKLLERHDVR